MKMPIGPKGWVDLAESEWGDLPRFLKEVEKIAADGDALQVLIARDILRVYGSSKRRPLSIVAFIKDKLHGGEMANRYGKAKEKMGIENARDIFDNFTLRQLEENLEVIYSVGFEGEESRLKGWLSGSEKADFISILKGLISEEEEKKFWELQKGAKRRDGWKRREDFSFREAWDKRVATIEKWILKFEAHPAPENYIKMGQEDLEGFLKLIRINASLEDVTAMTREFTKGEKPTMTTGAPLTQESLIKEADKTMNDFIGWCEMVGFGEKVIERMKTWAELPYEKRVEGLADNSPFSGNVTWGSPPKIKLKGVNFWNELPNPSHSLRVLIWHEMTHILQVAGLGLKAAENSMFLIELQAVLSEIILAYVEETLMPEVIRSMQRRAVLFTLGLEMHDKKTEESPNFAILREIGISNELESAVLNSLKSSPFNLQQYWLALAWIAGKIGQETVTLDGLVSLYKEMIKTDKGEIAPDLTSTIEVTLKSLRGVLKLS